MTRANTSYDRRLIGTWKSDRRKTFRHYVRPPEQTDEQFRKLRQLFGHLVVRFSRTHIHSWWDGDLLGRDTYQILGSDSDSIAISTFSKLEDEDRIAHLHFEGQYFWNIAGGVIREYFRRVETKNQTGNELVRTGQSKSGHMGRNRRAAQHATKNSSPPQTRKKVR